jgi:hypothetical protein
MSASPSRPGLRLDSFAWDTVCRLAAQTAASPGYVYPWHGLEGDLERLGQQLLLVGYGSLMNAVSAGQTLRTSPGRRPVVAFGARRVFNYAMAEMSLARYGPCNNAQQVAALNVYRSDSVADMVNGVCLAVAVGEVPALRQRETGYDLFPVPCLWWNVVGAIPFVAHVLGAPDEPHSGPRYTGDDLQPHPVYYRVCRDGAASVSADFLNFYLDSTYLADRRTSLRRWEQTGPA